MQIVPLRFLSYRYKKERYVAFKIRQTRFRPGLCPGPRWGSLRRSPRLPSRLERGHPSPYPPHSAPTHLRRSPCVPLRIPTKSTPMSRTSSAYQRCRDHVQYISNAEVQLPVQMSTSFWSACESTRSRMWVFSCDYARALSKDWKCRRGRLRSTWLCTFEFDCTLSASDSLVCLETCTYCMDAMWRQDSYAWDSLTMTPSPPIDSIWAMMFVWR